MTSRKGYCRHVLFLGGYEKHRKIEWFFTRVAMGCTGINGLKVPEFLHVLFNVVIKYSPVFFWLQVCTLFLKKQGQNIEMCTIKATRRNKR